MTKRLLLGLAVCLAIILPLTIGAAEGKRKSHKASKRVAEGSYNSPAVGAYVGPTGSGAWYYDCTDGTGCVPFLVRANERYVTLEIQDNTSPYVYAEVRSIDTTLLGFFCVRTDQSIPVGGYQEILVHILGGLCHNGSPSAPTEGIVKAIFSGRP
ncbi:MAG: hypothetical protein ACRDH6_01595 [Actinomycetota bacterium]